MGVWPFELRHELVEPDVDVDEMNAPLERKELLSGIGCYIGAAKFSASAVIDFISRRPASLSMRTRDEASE